MIDKSSAIQTLLERLEKLPSGHCLEIRTYKRNRRIMFRRDAQATWSILQEGFEHRLHQGVPRDKLRKLLQSLLRKEFPRSSKIRVYVLGPVFLEQDAKLERKIL
ncbi:MAG TPA: hypothetical protein ENN39_12060 [Desulfonatronum sp.]|nr:hypothetical protein [Desulfonatronum sp.]